MFIRRIIIATFIAGLLPLGFATASQAQNLDQISQRLEELKAEIRELESNLESRVSAVEETSEYLEEEVEDLDDRMTKPERHTALDKIELSGDFRFEAHSIKADVPDHYNGIQLQRGLVDTLFYFGANGAPPASPDDLGNYIAGNFADYQYYLSQLNYDDLSQTLASFPPAQQQQLMGNLLPGTFVPGYPADNDILYTNRLRLRMHADVAERVSFDGRLSMYKVWGDSTGVQVFNGQPTSISWDGTSATVPNSDVLRVERAYFTWSDIGGYPLYLSIGRRPSTDGVPLNFRQDEPRGGTPLGSLINYQFDGLTLGYHLSDYSTIRFCYGVGFESDWGTGSLLNQPANRLDDAAFYGINWDIWNTDEMFVQATIATASDVPDGFNGTVVLPVDPLSGQAIAAPVILRYTPSTTVGDIDLASIVLVRHDGPFDWFASFNYMESDPNNVTTPFGGLFTDPFGIPQSQDGNMYYLGARYKFNGDMTKFGLEFNHGSEYWFNFALAEDDILGPKTSVRGDVWEMYLTHRIRDRFVFKAAYIDYSYDYSGSGWLLGAPQDLSATPVIGFPTYSDASKLSLSLTARF